MATDEEKKLRKKAKKEAKLKLMAEASKASKETDEPAPVEKKAAKKVKASKKAVEVEAVDGGDEAVGKKRKAENGVKVAKKPKNNATDGEVVAPPVKKQKSAEANGKAKAAPRFASVGDQELAKAGLPIVKALYTEHDEVAAMTDAEVAEYQEQRTIQVAGTVVKPVTAFHHLGFESKFLHAVSTFKAPSPIQAQCWPVILKGWDLIGIAATGSGKTLAFGIPALRHIAEQRARGVVKGRGPVMLCMAPTRELACQISAVLADAGSKCGVSSVTIYGGVPKRDQINALRKGADIAVGTPGRVCDLLQEEALKLSDVTYLVLDEADRMLDMGFEPEIRKIVTCIRADRQTLMFSATWPTEIQRLAMEFLVKPIKVTIGSQDLAASDSVTQTVEVVEDQERNDKLIALLEKHHKNRNNRILIFVLYKKEAPRIESLLARKRWKAVAIHGDMSQSARTQAVEDFKTGAIPLLIATDVAARGLDIPDVEMVINYSFPLTVEDYVHRIGRTGRAGKTGLAHTFFVGANDKVRAGELVNVLREAGAEVPAKLMSFGTAVKKKESKLYGSHFKEVDMSAKASKITFGDDSDED